MVPDTAEASLRVTAVAADGRIAVTEPLACRPLLIDPFLFPGTGARTVDVAADFDVASPPSITVELVAEGREDDPAASTLLHLARGTPPGRSGAGSSAPPSPPDTAGASPGPGPSSAPTTHSPSRPPGPATRRTT